MRISVWGCRDAISFVIGWQLPHCKISSSRMSSCSRWNKRIIAITTEVGPPRLKSRGPSWSGVEFSARHPWFLWNKGSKSKISKRYIYTATFWRLWCFFGPSNTSAIKNGRSNRNRSQSIELKQISSGTTSICRNSSHLRNGSHTRSIPIRLTIAYRWF